MVLFKKNKIVYLYLSWLVELPYWFKANFCPKCWDFSTTLSEIDNFIRSKIRLTSHLSDSSLLDIFTYKHP